MAIFIPQGWCVSMSEYWPPAQVSLTPGKRVLFLTKDLDLILGAGHAVGVPLQLAAQVLSGWVARPPPAAHEPRPRRRPPPPRQRGP
ncbi:MAG TPA: hypothetical protein EYQ80_00110, partial [Candidatus Poseidoniales archaeon]|nr:hypothetical protein [Candidatus Poseidoniales archaeon]